MGSRETPRSHAPRGDTRLHHRHARGGASPTPGHRRQNDRRSLLPTELQSVGAESLAVDADQGTQAVRLKHGASIQEMCPARHALRVAGQATGGAGGRCNRATWQKAAAVPESNRRCTCQMGQPDRQRSLRLLGVLVGDPVESQRFEQHAPNGRADRSPGDPLDRHPEQDVVRAGVCVLAARPRCVLLVPQGLRRRPRS